MRSDVLYYRANDTLVEEFIATVVPGGTFNLTGVFLNLNSESYPGDQQFFP